MSSSSEASVARARSRVAVSTVREFPLADLRGASAPHALAETLLGSLAQDARQRGFEEGYVAGRTEGLLAARAAAEAEAQRADSVRAAAEAVRAQEHADALAALESAALQVRGRLEELTAAIEGQATDLAFALVETLMAREVAQAGGADVVRRVLQVLPSTARAATATVRLHPSIVPEAQRLSSLGLAIVADASLKPADAVVETDGAVVDLRIEAAMQRVREVLS